MAKYLFMYVSGGAGHVGRSLTVANYLRKIDSENEIIFAGGKVGKEIIEENGHRFLELKTPEYFQDNIPVSDIRELCITYLKNFSRYRNSIISIEPDVVIVDTEPIFVFLSKFLGFRTVFISHELIPLWITEISPISKKVRDFVLKWAGRISDFVIFPNIMGIKPNDKGISGKCMPVGPLGYLDFQRKYLKGEKKILVVPSSTGNIPFELIHMLRKHDYEIYIRSSGTSEKNIHFLERTENLMSYIDAVDVVLCSGYSTIMEAVALGKPLVIYPKTEEQRIVGRLCDRNGIALYAESPQEVIGAIEQIFTDAKLRETMVNKQKSYRNGSLETARFLIEIGAL